MKSLCNYILEICIIIAGIVALIIFQNIFLGLFWIILGVVMLILLIFMNRKFKRDKAKMDEMFKKIREGLGIDD